MSSMMRTVSICFILALFILPAGAIAPKTIVVQNHFGSGNGEMKISFSRGDSKLVEIPFLSNATYEFCSMDIRGEEYGGEYPTNVSIDIGADGIDDWSFSSKLGMTDTFDSGRKTVRYDLTGEQKFNTGESISIPQGAGITSASLNLTPKGGYSEALFLNVNDVRSMVAVEDEMWFATDTEALIRRDAITESVNVFTNTDGLNNSMITALAADEDYVYAGSETMGVTIWDRKLDDFSERRWDKGTVDDFSNNIRRIHSDGSWVLTATEKKVYVFKKDDTFGQFINAWTEDEDGLVSLDIRDIETWENRIYFATDKGISVYDRGTELWNQINLENGLVSNNVNDLLLSEGLIYIATTQGISRYDHLSGEFITAIDEANLPNIIVTALTQNATSIFAVAKQGASDSVTEIRKSTGEAVGETWSKSNTELDAGPFSDILFYGGEIYVAAPSGVYTSRFDEEAFRHVPLTNNQLEGNSITALHFDDHEKLLYISTDGGISRYDPDNKLFKEPWTRDSGLASIDVTSIVSTDDTIYVGTATQGVARWSRSEMDWLDSLDRFTAPVSLTSNKISSLSLGENTLYIGHRKGVDRYIISSDRVKNIPRWDTDTFNATSREGVFINDIALDEDFIFVAHSPVYDNQELVSEGGLWIYNRTDSFWQFITNHSTVGDNLTDQEIHCLAQNSTHLFIGTGNGLNIMNKNNLNISLLNESTDPLFLGGAVKEILFDNSTVPMLYMAVEAVLNHTLGHEVGEGILVVDVESGIVQRHMNDTNMKDLRGTDEISCMALMDKILLFGTESSGLSRVDTETWTALDPSQPLGRRQFPYGLSLDLGDDGEIDFTYEVFDEPAHLDITDIMQMQIHYSSDTYADESDLTMSRIALNISIRPDSIGIIEISELDIQYEFDFVTQDFSNVVNEYISDMPQAGGDNEFFLPVRITSTSAGTVILREPVIIYGLSNPPVLNISSPRPDGTYWDTAPITFDAKGTYDPDGDPLEYRWTVEKDTEFKGTSKKFQSLLSRGWHNITLNVSEPSGRSYLTSVVIRVVANKAPVVNIESPLDNVTYFIGEEVTFSAWGSADPNGDVLSYNWLVGENVNKTEKQEKDTEEIKIIRKKVGTGSIFKYSFDRSGYYNISLDITDGSLTSIAYVNLYITFRMVDRQAAQFETELMSGLIVDYEIVHSSYRNADMILAPVSLDDMGDMLKAKLDDQTHIGSWFTLDITTENTVFNETLNVSYESQEEFLENVNLSTLGLYYFHAATLEDKEKSKDDGQWKKCAVIEHDIENRFILCDIPQDERIRGEITTFALLANISRGPGPDEKWLHIDMLDPRPGAENVPINVEQEGERKEVIVTLNFSSKILESTLRLVIRKGDVEVQPAFEPSLGGGNLTFQLSDVEYDTDYEICVEFVMDEFRHVSRGKTWTFHTEKEDKGDSSRPMIWYIIPGVIIILLFGALIYFFLLRGRDEMEEIEELEVLSCPRCGLVLEGEDVDICPECGFEMEEKGETVIEVEFINCPGCDAKIDNRSKICPFCSLQLKEDVEEETEEEVGIDLEELVDAEAPSAAGVPMDIECPTCGEMVEEGMSECPACGEMEFGM